MFKHCRRAYRIYLDATLHLLFGPDQPFEYDKPTTPESEK